MTFLIVLFSSLTLVIQLIISIIKLYCMSLIFRL